MLRTSAFDATSYSLSLAISASSSPCLFLLLLQFLAVVFRKNLASVRDLVLDLLVNPCLLPHDLLVERAVSFREALLIGSLVGRHVVFQVLQSLMPPLMFDGGL